MTQPIKLGPLALLLTVISICLTVMAVLNWTSARADRRLADKYAATVESRYALEAEGQRWLAGFAAMSDAEKALAADEQDGIFITTLTGDDMHLRIGVAVLPDGALSVQEWTIVHDWNKDLTIEDLWDGME